MGYLARVPQHFDCEICVVKFPVQFLGNFPLTFYPVGHISSSANVFIGVPDSPVPAVGAQGSAASIPVGTVKGGWTLVHGWILLHFNCYNHVGVDVLMDVLGTVTDQSPIFAIGNADAVLPFLSQFLNTALSEGRHFVFGKEA